MKPHLVLAAVILLAACAATSPSDTVPPPSWCPHTDTATGQRYYAPCEQP